MQPLYGLEPSSAPPAARRAPNSCGMAARPGAPAPARKSHCLALGHQGDGSISRCMRPAQVLKASVRHHSNSSSAILVALCWRGRARTRFSTRRRVHHAEETAQCLIYGVEQCAQRRVLHDASARRRAARVAPRGARREPVGGAGRREAQRRAGDPGPRGGLTPPRRAAAGVAVGGAAALAATWLRTHGDLPNDSTQARLVAGLRARTWPGWRWAEAGWTRSCASSSRPRLSWSRSA